MHWVYRLLRKLRLVPLLASVLLGAGFGCASHRPAPVVIERQATGAMVNNTGSDLNLHFVTFNIWGLPGWMTGAPGGRYPRIARELQRLDADIVLLQEAWTAGARRAIPTNTQWAVARAAGQHTFFQQNGLVTLSKFPIVGGEFYPFTRGAFPDRIVNKGVLKVTVQLPDSRLVNIWNVHMQDGHATEVRALQVRELIAHVQSAEDGQVADLVGGDFNCTPDSELCQELIQGLGPNLQQLSHAAPFVTWDGLWREGRAAMIDYIFVRERAVFQSLQASQHAAFKDQDLKQRLSDHLGIEATVELGPCSNFAGPANPPAEGAQYHAVLARRAP